MTIANDRDFGALYTVGDRVLRGMAARFDLDVLALPYELATNDARPKVQRLFDHLNVFRSFDRESEAAQVLAAIPDPNLLLNWDPGNAAAIGETPFPNGYRLLPKGRIGHCHCKDVTRKSDGSYQWAAMGGGIIDWVGQFRALREDGYRLAASLETHWHGAGTPEESTRQSWAGMQKQLHAAEVL